MSSIQNLIIFCLIICSFATCYAQPLDITAPTLAGNTGDTVTVALLVNQFTDITSVEGNLSWDPSVATYVSHTVNPSLTGGTNVFSTGTPLNGLPPGKFSWVYFRTNGFVSGQSLPNGSILVEIRLRLIGAGGTSSPLDLTGPGPTASFTRFDPLNPTLPTSQSPSLSNGLLNINLSAQTGFIQTANICNDTTWITGSEIILDGYIFVKDSATLTIQPGVVVRGKDEVATNNILPNGTNVGAISVANEDVGALIITRSSKLDASGTAANPIIFTSVNDDLTDDSDLDCGDVGLWGGLIILGNATVNSPASNLNLSKGFIENVAEGINLTNPGVTELATYGGNQDNDTSGKIIYVSIRHGGHLRSPGDEINGLSLYGVGRGTEIDYIEVIANSDDGIEMFGGTVDIKHAVVSCVQDDAYDYDLGYRGRGQFWIALSDGNRLGEHDGGENPDQANPFSTPIVYNATYIDPGTSTDHERELIYFGDHAGGNYINSLFYQLDQGIEIEFRYDRPSSYSQFDNLIVDPTLGTLQALDITHNVFSNSPSASFFIQEISTGFVSSTQQMRSISDATAKAYQLSNGLVGNNLIVLDALTTNVGGAFNLRPSTTYPNLATTPSTGFFDPAPYTGAISPSAASKSDWLAGWTAIILYGLVEP